MRAAWQFRLGAFDAPALRRGWAAALKARDAEPLEFEQTLIRAAIGLVMTAYMAATAGMGGLDEGQAFAILAVLAGAWTAGLAGLCHLIYLPRRRIERRSTIIAVDALTLSLLLGLAGETAAIFAPVYLWATLGNGFLFGPRYMYGAIAANLGCFVIAALSAAFWRDAWELSLGLGLAIAGIPLYVTRLMGNFREVMIAAQAASRAKTEFISMISHELRTPLNAILGLAQLSKMTATSAKERFSAVSTELAAGRLLRMVDTILKFQRIESGAAERMDRDFDLLDSLNEIRAIIEPLARQKGLHFHTRFMTPLPARLHSDPDHIQTIILNLMANAVKYTRHGEISLEIGLSRGAKGKILRIAVRDTGDGIAPDVQLRIFERFVRGEQHATAGEPGVGLGLSMCKSLIELHGGTIGCESKPAEGSLFWAELPLAKPIGAANGGQAAAASRPAPVIWIGPAAAPAALAAAMARTMDAADILRSEARANPALAPYVLVADPANLSPEVRAAVTRCLLAERAPSLVLVGGRGNQPDHLDHLAAVAAYGRTDAEMLALIDTAARWQALLAPAADEEAPAVAVPANGPLSVLVADDNALNRDVMRRMLEIDGHKVTLAEDGDEALRVLLDGEVEIALLDISMPGLSGIDVCHNYRACLGSAQPVPIIGVTAAIYDELRDNCREAGMADLLGRPVSIEQIRAALARYRVAGTVPAGRPQMADDMLDAGNPIADVQRMQLLKDLFGEEKLHTQFLPSFKRDLGAGIARLRQAMRDKAPDLVRDAVHAIKSSASTAGAKEVLALALGFRGDATEAAVGDFEASIEAAYQRYCKHLGGGQPSSLPKRSAAGL